MKLNEGIVALGTVASMALANPVEAMKAPTLGEQLTGARKEISLVNSEKAKKREAARGKNPTNPRNQPAANPDAETQENVKETVSGKVVAEEGEQACITNEKQPTDVECGDVKVKIGGRVTIIKAPISGDLQKATEEALGI